jgi:DeoR family fructose operon transcriptional repressor
MYPEERQRWLLEVARQEGRVSVAQAVAEFSVASETIRRDLEALSGRGLVRRVHGGAIPSDFDQLGDAPLDARDTTAVEQKEAIAAAALNWLPAPGSALILDAGSTTYRLAAKLPPEAHFTIFTDSAPIAALAAARTACDVRLVGGRVRGTTQATVGNVIEFGRLRVDVAFMGTNALSASNGLSTPDPDEAATKAAMIAAARNVIVLADSRKIGAESTCRFADLSQIDVLITDTAIPDRQREALEYQEVQVICA